jgi:hypothetical protein
MVVIHKKKEETAEEKEARILREQERAQGIQDEYQAKGFELITWIQDHKPTVVALVLLLALAGGAVGAYYYYQRRMSEQASSAYIEIVRKLENLPKAAPENMEKYKEGQKELSELVQKYKGASVTVLADLWAGHLALQSNDALAAVAFYQGALKRVSQKDDLYPLALIGLGYAEESNNQKSEALARFASVAELKHNAGKDLALWEAARLSKDLNETEKARTYVTRLLEEFPNSIYEKNAKRLKGSL